MGVDDGSDETQPLLSASRVIKYKDDRQLEEARALGGTGISAWYRRRTGTPLWGICVLIVGVTFLNTLVGNLVAHPPTWLCDRIATWEYLYPSSCGEPPWADAINISPHHINDSEIIRDIPQYVLDYAPLVHLFSEEQFWPCDMAEHLLHVTPELDYTPIKDQQWLANLSNLGLLNEYEQGRHVFLTSNDNVEDRPDWLIGEENIPSKFVEEAVNDRHAKAKGKTLNVTFHGGQSDAPAVLVTVDKGNGIVDAFWFFFYSYNLGNVVLNIRFGNHVGDWEHTLVRFHHGRPVAVFFSEHNFGSAYSYEAVEKIGKRPIIYSATGTHAMYATPGLHPYILPLGLLHDETDRGPLWDPALNTHTYTYNHRTDTLTPSTLTPSSPTSWFYFAGHWGDKAYPINDKRQYGLVGEYHYVNGPLGPRFKHLGRRKICQGSYEDPCVIRHWLGAGWIGVEGEGSAPGEIPIGRGVGEGEDWSENEELLPPKLREGS